MKIQIWQGIGSLQTIRRLERMFKLLSCRWYFNFQEIANAFPICDDSKFSFYQPPIFARRRLIKAKMMKVLKENYELRMKQYLTA